MRLDPPTVEAWRSGSRTSRWLSQGPEAPLASLEHVIELVTRQDGSGIAGYRFVSSNGHVKVGDGDTVYQAVSVLEVEGPEGRQQYVTISVSGSADGIDFDLLGQSGDLGSQCVVVAGQVRAAYERGLRLMDYSMPLGFMRGLREVAEPNAEFLRERVSQFHFEANVRKIEEQIPAVGGAL